ncbi:MAG TPA: O-antigen ligase family protein [Vicinamibacterales bacterium]
MALIAWSIFAVGGVYVWAGAPLLAGGLLIAVGARPRVARSTETRPLDVALLTGLLAVAIQLVPLPTSLRTWVSPHGDSVRTSLLLSADAVSSLQPLSLAPGSTAYALALVATAMFVFWTARQVSGDGATRFLVRTIAFVGLVAALAAIVQRAINPKLIYGFWMPQDTDARPFGPFVNRNHFAAWVVMAIPLLAGYIAAALYTHRPERRLAGRVASAMRSLGSAALWVAVAGAVMTLALVTSASRSGLMAFGVALGCGGLIARTRLSRQGWIVALVAVALLALFVIAYADMTPLIWRIEETLLVGTGGRPEIWQETLRIFRDFWATGTGLGAYQTAMAVYQQGDRVVFFNQAHNQYLQLLAEGGLLLMIPAAAIVVAFVRLFVIRLARDTSSSAPIRLGAGVALVAVAVQGIWETPLRMPANGILFAVAAAIAVHRPLERIDPLNADGPLADTRKGI